MLFLVGRRQRGHGASHGSESAQQHQKKEDQTEEEAAFEYVPFISLFFFLCYIKLLLFLLFFFYSNLVASLGDLIDIKGLAKANQKHGQKALLLADRLRKLQHQQQVHMQQFGTFSAQIMRPPPDATIKQDVMYRMLRLLVLLLN
jgi:hypothetical protein